LRFRTRLRRADALRWRFRYLRAPFHARLRWAHTRLDFALLHWAKLDAFDAFYCLSFAGLRRERRLRWELARHCLNAPCSQAPMQRSVAWPAPFYYYPIRYLSPHSPGALTCLRVRRASDYFYHLSVAFATDANLFFRERRCYFTFVLRPGRVRLFLALFYLTSSTSVPLHYRGFRGSTGGTFRLILVELGLRGLLALYAVHFLHMCLRVLWLVRDACNILPLCHYGLSFPCDLYLLVPLSCAAFT